jgi:hypothetical protein
MAGDETALYDGIEVSCCACDGRVRFLTPQSSEHGPLLGHSEPVCERFLLVEDEEQAADYARDCRLALGKRGQA